MLTGDIKNQIDRIWDAFWSGGISSKFKNFQPADMFTVVSEHTFPFLRTLWGDDSAYTDHMKDARFSERDGRALHVAPASGVQGRALGS